jgi:hypothetical protein
MGVASVASVLEANDWVGGDSASAEPVNADAESARYSAAAGNEVETISAATPNRAPMAVTFEVALLRADPRRCCCVTR